MSEIRIVGDVCFSDGFFDLGFGIGSKLKYNYNPFENLRFDSGSIWFGNLECVVSDISDKIGYKSKHFRISYEKVSSLHHFNIYGVANNHLMQHGADAYCEMLANIKKIGSKYVGNISNKTIVIDYKGYKIGFVVFSQRGDQFSEKPLYWLRPEYEEIEIESNKMQDCDFKIVYIHWGNEFMDYPNIEQKKFAHWLIDIGFDLVVGSHPHVLQGYEVYKEKFIFYSLGNFLFNMPAEATRYSAIVNVDVEMGKLKVCYDYVFIDKENRPKIIEIQYVPKKYLFSTLNNKISFEGDNEDYYKEMFRQLSIYRKKNHYWMLTTFLKHSPKELFFTYSNYLLRQLKR